MTASATAECIDVRRLSDPYIDHELVDQARHFVLLHLIVCLDCRELIQEKIRWKNRVRTTVRNVRIPESLKVRIQQESPCYD